MRTTRSTIAPRVRWSTACTATRRTKLGRGHGFGPHIFDEPLAILGAVLLGRLHDQLVHLIVVDRHPVPLPNLGEEQAEPDPALGDVAIILALALHLGPGGRRIL